MNGSALAGAQCAPEWFRASWRKIGVLSRIVGAGALGAALLVEPASAGPMALDGKFAVGSGGSATYNIPIAVPPGTAGMVPNLSLDYDSGRGSGIVGVGWALNGFSAIRRCPQTVAQDTAKGRIGYDSADRYCLDGSRLMVVTGTYGADLSEYRTEIESFAKVIAHGTAGNGPSWFEVKLPNGRTMELGNTTDSKILAKGKTSVRVWAVNKITDPKGNYQTFTYNNDTTNGSYYPTRIDYTGHASPAIAPYASVQFSYVTRAATDQVVTYIAGSTTKLVNQLSEIKTYVGATQVLSYKLTYEATANSGTGVPRLASVQMCDPANLCQPATTFTWSNAANATVTYPTWGDWATAPGNATTSKPVPERGGLAPYDSGAPRDLHRFLPQPNQANSRPGLGEIGAGDGDINGDGLADVLINNNGALSVSLSTGTGFTIPASTGITTNSPQLFDLFAAGKPDVIALNNSNQLVRYTNNGAGGFNTTAQVLVNIGVTHPLFGDIYTPAFSDLNGDSRPDMVWHGLTNQFFRAMNNGTGFGAAQSITTTPMKMSGSYCQAPAGCSSPVYGAATIQFANLQGRGAVDLVYTFQSVVGKTCPVNGACTGYGTASNPGPWEVWYSLWNGTGYNAPALVKSVMHSNDSQWCGSSEKGQTCPNNFPVLSTRIADINGDGLSDLYVSYEETLGWNGAPIPASQFFYIFNGTNFSQSTPNLAAASCDEGLQFRDLYGSGRTDAVCVDGVHVQIARPNAAATAFTSLTALSTAPDVNEWWLKDFNGDGYLDFLLQGDNNHYYVALSQRAGGAPADLLTGITTGLGATTAIAYDTPAKAGTALYTKGTTGTNPRLDIVPTDYVVKQVDRSNGIGGLFSSTYKYGGAQFETTGRGFTGFGSTTTKDLGTNIETVTSYRLDYPYTGLVSGEVKTLGAVTLANVANTHTATSLGGTRYLPLLSGSVLTSADLDGTALPSVTTSYSYDAFGNPTVVSATASDGYSSSTTNAYTNDTTRWILGQMTQSQVSKTVP